MIFDLRTIADIFRVSEKAVRGWIGKGLPVHEHGSRGGARRKTKIRLEDAARWWFQTNAESLALTRARARLASEQADKTALDNAARRQDLAPLPLIRVEFGKLLTEIRDLATAIPAKVAPALEGQDVAERQATLQCAIDEFLDRAAGGSPGQA